jgi:hypothetical protein
LDIKDKVLISGSWGEGKSDLALRYTELIPVPFSAASFDSERGQDLYVVDDPRQAVSGELYFCHRVKAPTLYEVRFLVEKLRDPKRPTKEIRINKEPVNAEIISKEVKDLANAITTGSVQVTTLIFDTVTRFCDQTTSAIFDAYERRYGADKAERMSQFAWAKVKDDISETFYAIIESDLNMIMTAWAKDEYDSKANRRTGEVIADVLKNVNAFVDLSLMLYPNKDRAGNVTYPPAAVVMKSRIRRLKKGDTIPKVSWEAIRSYRPEPKVVETEEEDEKVLEASS